MNSKNKEIIVMGFGLFAMFLGAGNIIFPPYIGIVSGEKWPAGLSGFAVTGIGMPLLGLLATFRAGGNIDKFAGKVSLPFAKAFNFAILLCIATAVAGYFEKLLDKKLSYRGLVWIIVTASAVLSVYGVRHIISLSVPVLYALYPVAIVLILLNLVDRGINPGVYRGAVVGAFLVGILYGLQHVSAVAERAKNMLAAIPLGQEGFAWIFTSILGGIVGAARTRTRERRKNAVPQK